MFDERENKDLEKPRNPEVSTTKKKRKRFTAEYKRRILKEADACRGKTGATAALLRREGIYSSTLSQWRQQRDQGGLSALGKIRGPKPKFTEAELEQKRLEKENQRLREKLEQAKLLIEAQKKVASILGNSLEILEEKENIHGGTL